MTRPLSSTASQLAFNKKVSAKNLKINKEADDENIFENDKEEEEQYEQLVNKAQLLPNAGHQVFIIQPFVKWGPKKNKSTTPDLMLEEAVALIDSLPRWKCVDTVKMPVETLDKKQLFGAGQFEKLQQEVRRNPMISAVFVSTNRLRGIQKKELETAFGVPVYDRYLVVLQIFKERAKTYEAKLQVAYAEIPYLRSCIVSLQQGAKGGSAKEGGGSASIGGSGESYFETQIRLLDRRESKVKTELEKLSKKRALLKLQRTKREFPVVAILGYTNSGKTTLIKALTGDNNIQPRDALFATLDVTAHACRLPCNLSTLLVDTVGFISDIPTQLIAAFQTTLRDAIDADVLVHIQDASHPDWEHQVSTVIATLEMLDPNLSTSIIQVANKIDKLPTGAREDLETKDVICISATKGTGLAYLVEIIQSKVLEVTGRRYITLRIPNGGEEYSWISKEAAVISCIEDKSDQQYLIIEVVVTQALFGKFKSKFPYVKMFRSN